MGWGVLLHRWRVAAVDPATNRLAAERLDDGARTAFAADYVREYVSLGYAVTVHSAQGVTADTSHAVLGENSTRALLYVAMTRGRDTNTAYVYERGTEAGHGPDTVTAGQLLRRDDSGQAARPPSGIALGDGDRPVTGLSVAAQTPAGALPQAVAGLLQRRAALTQNLRQQHETLHADRSQRAHQRTRARSRSIDNGLEI